MCFCSLSVPKNKFGGLIEREPYYNWFLDYDDKAEPVFFDNDFHISPKNLQNQLFTVSNSKFEEHTEIITYIKTGGVDQLFVVNFDNTISPFISPSLIFGTKRPQNKILLVHRSNYEAKLMFPSLKPSYRAKTMVPLTLSLTGSD
jgi:hypothetical protein